MSPVYDPFNYWQMPRSITPGWEAPYYQSAIPRPIYPAIPYGVAPEMVRSSFVPFGFAEHLSPEAFISGPAQPSANYLSPELVAFLRAAILRCGKALRTVAPTLEHDNEEVKKQAHLAATAQFFYALGLLYTRGFIIPPEVPGATTREEEETSASTACELFGEALERFAREQFVARGAGREISLKKLGSASAR
jgi:hypothetical protein